MRNNKLVWNVYIENINAKEIEIYNIFEHTGFLKDIQKAFKESDNLDIFKEKVKRTLMYYFRSKSEWEIVLTDWPPSNTFKNKKIDVYNQVALNFDIFINYIWKEFGGNF